MNDARDLATAKFKIDKLQHHDYEFVSSDKSKLYIRTVIKGYYQLMYILVLTLAL